MEVKTFYFFSETPKKVEDRWRVSAQVGRVTENMHTFFALKIFVFDCLDVCTMVACI